jgi:hypothetical protein
MPDHNLTLRRTVIGGDRLDNNYTVWLDERPIGRIKFSEGKTAQVPGWAWFITVPLPVPSLFDGSSDTLEGAMAGFREAWERFYAGLTPSDIEHWHQVAGAQRREG